MPHRLRALQGAIVLTATLCTPVLLPAQASDPAALTAVRAAVHAELQANKVDHSIWMYTEHNVSPGKDVVYDTVETHHGSLQRMIELNGQKLSGSAEQAETQRIQDFLHDRSAQAKKRKASQHDDKQAAEMLKMLPEAFIWTNVSENPQEITVRFRPNPSFNPPDMQSRVMGQMAGEMVITRDGNRIKSLHGKLTENVLIGWGILGKLNRGGTFDIERRQLPGDRWQIDQTHVHIGGRALLFKTIGQQEDDVKTDWKPSPANTLEEAARILHAE